MHINKVQFFQRQYEVTDAITQRITQNAAI